MRLRTSLVRGDLVALLAVAACGGAASPARNAELTAPAAAGADLRPVESFATIADRDARARALFVEASRVLMHPRCLNCHPAGDVPSQGDQLRPHDPPVVRGAKDEGVPGLECRSCHQEANLELARVPGAPKWHLAPIEMAWQGKTAAQICEQIKDPKRNGNKTIAEIVEHSANDPLVAWGWAPGHGRAPAPGTQKKLGALMDAWMRDGAACPSEQEKPR